MVSRDASCFRVGDLIVDPGRAQVWRDDTEISLPRLSLDLLLALIEAAPNVVSVDELMQRVWPGLVVSPETVSQRVKLVRDALGDNSRSPRYIAGVRGRGYRLVAPVESVATMLQAPQPGDGAATEAGARDAAEPVGPPAAARSPITGGLPTSRRNVLAAGALITALTVTLAHVVPSDRAADPAARPPVTTPATLRPVLAVLPFASMGGADDQFALPDGLQSDILTKVSRIHALDVIAATSVERYRGSSVPAREIAAQLGATHLLEGSVQKVGSRVRINAQLIDARHDRHIWADTYDYELTAANLFAVQGEIALAVAEAMQAALTRAERAAAGTVSTENLDAWATEKAARAQLARRTTDSIIEAERQFRQAIALDPRYARAYAGLADAIWLKADYAGLPWLPAVTEAERLVNLALRIDPDLPEALATRAKIAESRLDFATAEAVYRRVFEVNPSYASAHAWYAQLLYQQGREHEAAAAQRRAVELDPMSAWARVNMAVSVARPDDLTASLAWIEKARAIDPANPAWPRGMAIVHAFAGRFDEALRWTLAALDLDPRSAHALSEAGRMHLELDDLDRAGTWLARATGDGREVAGAWSHAALLHLYIGERDEAVALSRRALALAPGEAQAFMVLDAEALRRHDPAAVVDAVQRNYPDLAGPEEVRIRRNTLHPATDLALALRRSGDAARSDALLAGASAFLDAARSGGSREYGIDRVRVAAVRGHADSALRGLEELVASGWRGPYWRFYRDHDPAFDALRADRRFRAAFAVLEQDIRSQRLSADRAGNLDRPPPDASGHDTETLQSSR